MGLDSYLYAKKHLCSLYNGEKQQKQFKSVARLIKGSKFVIEDDLQFAEVKLQVGYWRKANQIHNYFVDKCAGGKDECQDIYVDRDALKDLMLRCQTVLKDRSQAKDLLPTQSGFFFGSTDYDEYYYQDLEHTIEILNKILKESPEDWEFEYRASW